MPKKNKSEKEIVEEAEIARDEKWMEYISLYAPKVLEMEFDTLEQVIDCLVAHIKKQENLSPPPLGVVKLNLPNM